MSIKIEKDLPVPEKKTGLPGVMRNMSVGDSFVLPSAKRAYVYTAARYSGVKVSVRVESDTTIRVWRIK